jgi:hypothetical protein
MTTSVADISTSEALIAALKRDPAKSAVLYTQRPDGTFAHAVMICEADSAERWTLVNYIVESSEACQLLDLAYDAGGDGKPGRADENLWSSLPIRYGPWCSSWTLPEHPEAFKVFRGEPSFAG